jgi:hypothetical protein
MLNVLAPKHKNAKKNEVWKQIEIYDVKNESDPSVGILDE